MKIKQITWQNRNDFSAIMECEHCGHEAQNDYGYDDVYYHTKVIPAMRCKECGKDREALAELEKEEDKDTTKERGK